MSYKESSSVCLNQLLHSPASCVKAIFVAPIYMDRSEEGSYAFGMRLYWNQGSLNPPLGLPSLAEPLVPIQVEASISPGTSPL